MQSDKNHVRKKCKLASLKNDKTLMESLKSILVPTDFSPTAWQAVLMGIRISIPSKANLHLVHFNAQEDAEYQEEVRYKLQDISENLSKIYNLQVDSCVMSGDPSKAMALCVRDQVVDLVVIGMKGTGSKEVGTFAREILKLMKCPVLVVPSGEMS